MSGLLIIQANCQHSYWSGEGRSAVLNYKGVTATYEDSKQLMLSRIRENEPVTVGTSYRMLLGFRKTNLEQVTICCKFFLKPIWNRSLYVVSVS